MKDIEVYQTNLFRKNKKKLNKNQIEDLDNAVKTLIKNPKLGEQKTGGLSDIWVYKFLMKGQQYLLAYTWNEESRTLIALGLHKKFYRDLKRSIRH